MSKPFLCLDYLAPYLFIALKKSFFNSCAEGTVPYTSVKTSPFFLNDFLVFEAKRIKAISLGSYFRGFFSQTINCLCLSKIKKPLSSFLISIPKRSCSLLGTCANFLVDRDLICLNFLDRGFCDHLTIKSIKAITVDITNISLVSKPIIQPREVSVIAVIYQKSLLRSLRISDSLGISGYVMIITPSIVFRLLRDSFLDIDTKASCRPVFGSHTKKRLSFLSSLNFQKMFFMISPSWLMSASLNSSWLCSSLGLDELEAPFWYPKNHPAMKNTPQKKIVLNPILKPFCLGACHV